MGVPVVTLCGRIAVRAGGLEPGVKSEVHQLVAHTPEAFTRIAISLWQEIGTISPNYAAPCEIVWLNRL